MITVGTIPSWRSTREPHGSRVKMSRPKLSVPNRCVDDGGSRLLARSVLTGSKGVKTGAARAAATTSPTMSRPIHAERGRASRRGASRPAEATGTAPAMSVVADTRVEEGVGEVGQQVHQDHEDREHEGQSLHHRIVTTECGLDEQKPRPGDGVHRFRYDGSTHQEPEIDPQDGDGRDE